MSISVGPGQLERSLAAALTKARAPFLTSKKREEEEREREKKKVSRKARRKSWEGLNF